MKYTPRSKYKKGEISEGVLIVLALFLIIFVFIIPNAGKQIKTDLDKQGAKQESAWSTSSDSSPRSSRGYSSASTAAADIRIGSGNAGSEIQSYLEYITLYNDGRNDLNLTGLTLTNAKDKRIYVVGGNSVRYPQDSVIIPEGSLFISPSGNSPLQNIVLKEEETAIVTSGRIGNQIPYRITSFKENMCSGYLESSGNYAFTPSLEKNCPEPKEEAGFNDLDDACKDLLNGFRSCHMPKFGGTTRDNEPCNGCIDGVSGLSNACVAFIKTHFNYPSCIANHQNDQGFNSSTWRIFLGQKGELWNVRSETISLLDRLGNLISSKSY